ncbi:MAG: hypothetical protein ACT4OP_10060 [Actinomycetota bacterium]
MFRGRGAGAEARWWAEAASLFLELTSMAWALRRRGWWRRRPFVPLPDRAYVEWRAYTAYGDRSARISRSDLASYLRWRRRYRQFVGSVPT